MVLRYNNFWIVKKFYSKTVIILMLLQYIKEAIQQPTKKEKFVRDLKKISYERKLYLCF
jgi:hypothetical protein